MFPPVVVGVSLLRTCRFCHKRAVLYPGVGITILEEGNRTVPVDCACEASMVKEAMEMEQKDPKPATVDVFE